MDLVALRAFVAVAELSSFSRAAEALHLAQPGVSQQIKRLERDLGAAVLQRSTRRVELTAAGASLLPRAKAVLAEVQRAEAEVRALEAGVAGRVAVGFVGTATYDLLPRVVRTLRERLPAVELEVHGEQLTPVLVEGLRSRRLDIAVMRRAAPDASLQVRHLRSEPLIAVLPADHPLAGDGAVPLAALRDSAFVTYPSGHRSVVYDAVVHACRQVGSTPAEVVEVRETATLVAFVAAGIGVALVPEPVRSLALDGVTYASLTDLDARTELVLATRSEALSPTVQHVADLMALATTAADGSVGRPSTGRSRD